MNKRTIKVTVVTFGLMLLSGLFANPDSIFYSESLNGFLVGIACFALANVFIPETDEEEKE